MLSLRDGGDNGKQRQKREDSWYKPSCERDNVVVRNLHPEFYIVSRLPFKRRCCSQVNRFTYSARNRQLASYSKVNSN
jgi:hypothetical protein